jgi:hypothetical protein
MLSRLVGAWALVAGWWLLAAAVTVRLGLATWSGPLVAWRVAEALLLTLFGSLWFASLGSGEWWLLFLLVGGLVAGAARAERSGGPARTALGILVDVLRYVIAGGILAARLG